MKKIVSYVSGFAVAIMLLSAPAVSAAPGDVLDQSCAEAQQAGTALCQGRDQELFEAGGVFTTIINTIIYVIGAAAVVMIIIGGFRYVVSNGDSGSITTAKNTILYAVVGLVVAIMSYAIVNFVIGSI